MASVFAQAVIQLGGRGIGIIREGLSLPEWLALAALTVAFVWGEGVQSLEKRWVPYVVARARSLRHEPRLLMRVLAPLYAMALIGASRGTLLRTWLGVFAVVAAVVIVRMMPDPWRGMIDFAVAAALAWALLAILLCSWRSLREPGQVERSAEGDRPRDRTADPEMEAQWQTKRRP